MRVIVSRPGPFYGQFGVQKWLFSASFQDSCHVGVLNEGRSSTTAIGLSNDCTQVFIAWSLTLWCNAVVYFQVEMSCFSTRFKRTIRNQLGPSCKSDRVRRPNYGCVCCNSCNFFFSL